MKKKKNSLGVIFKELKSKQIAIFPYCFLFLMDPGNTWCLLFWFCLLTKTMLFFIIKLTTFSFPFLFQFMATWHHHKITSHRHCLILFHFMTTGCPPFPWPVVLPSWLFLQSWKGMWMADGIFPSNNRATQRPCTFNVKPSLLVRITKDSPFSEAKTAKHLAMHFLCP